MDVLAPRSIIYRVLDLDKLYFRLLTRCKKEVKKLKVTGGGLRTKTDSDSPSDEVSGHQSSDEDGSGHEAVMLGGDVRFNFHIGVNGPDEDTPKGSKNLWSLYFDVGMHQEAMVKWFPFFFLLSSCSASVLCTSRCQPTCHYNRLWSKWCSTVFISLCHHQQKIFSNIPV